MLLKRKGETGACSARWQDRFFFFFFFFKVINEVYFWCRNKQIEQLYRIENSETGHAYMEMIG